MTVDLIRFAAATTMPWANGGGTTHEIAREPATGDFDWRISVADVAQDGDFSALPGIDRVIVFCEGSRMVLTVDGDIVELRPGVPFGFDGGAAVSCEVPDGPTRDLNVMTRRGVLDADVTAIDVAADGTTVTGDVLLIALDGTTVAESPDWPGNTPLDTFDLIRVVGGSVTLSGAGRLIRVGLAQSSS